MNSTIFFLAWLAIIIGYGGFILSLVGYLAYSFDAKHGDIISQIVVSKITWIEAARWRCLLIGIIATIVLVTAP